MPYILTRLLYRVFSVSDLYYKFVHVKIMGLLILIRTIERKTDEICYDGLKAGKLQFVS